MSNLANSFASGSNMVIRVGGHKMAYATSLSFSDDVSHAAIGGIGSYSYDTQEPLQYASRGSLVITRYTTAAYDAITGKAPAKASSKHMDALGADDNGVKISNDGNSLFVAGAFNPLSVLTSLTFDIDVFSRNVDVLRQVDTEKDLIYTLKDCRFTAYSMDFSPGSLVTERLAFICIRVEDAVAQAISGNGTPPAN